MKYRIVSRGKGEFKQYKAQKLVKTIFGNYRWKNIWRWDRYADFFPKIWLRTHKATEHLINDNKTRIAKFESRLNNTKIEKEYK